MCLHTFHVGFERRSDVARVRATASQAVYRCLSMSDRRGEIFLVAARKIFLTESHPFRQKSKPLDREGHTGNAGYEV